MTTALATGDIGAYGGLCAGLSAAGGHESDDAGRGTVDVPRLSVDGQIDGPVRSLPYVADAADPLQKGLLVRHFTPLQLEPREAPSAQATDEHVSAPLRERFARVEEHPGDADRRHPDVGRRLHAVHESPGVDARTRR